MYSILKNSGLVLVDSVNYNAWQYKQFKKYVGSRVLEIGCGLGNLTQYLVNDAKSLLSIDIKDDAVEYAKKRFSVFNNITIKCCNVFEEDLAGYSNIDTIVFSNVLEHIQDDIEAMCKCHKILKPTKGKLLLLVPAHRFLYGTLDRESGHYRRYSKKDIVALASESGFKIKKLYCFNFIGALGWFVNYCLLRRKNTNNKSSTFQVSWFDKIFVGPSRYIESKIKPPMGISLVSIMEAE